MWAGGRLTFNAPLLLGQAVEKISTIKDVVEKDGRTGKLCFVTVRHDVYRDDTLALTEEHDIVYREAPVEDATPPKARNAPHVA